jgi:hypothetical protein
MCPQDSGREDMEYLIEYCGNLGVPGTMEESSVFHLAMWNEMAKLSDERYLALVEACRTEWEERPVTWVKSQLAESIGWELVQRKMDARTQVTVMSACCPTFFVPNPANDTSWPFCQEGPLFINSLFEAYDKTKSPTVKKNIAGILAFRLRNIPRANDDQFMKQAKAWWSTHADEPREAGGYPPGLGKRSVFYDGTTKPSSRPASSSRASNP